MRGQNCRAITPGIGGTGRKDNLVFIVGLDGVGRGVARVTSGTGLDSSEANVRFAERWVDFEITAIQTVYGQA